MNVCRSIVLKTTTISNKKMLHTCEKVYCTIYALKKKIQYTK
jgi:hypothetical protein